MSRASPPLPLHNTPSSSDPPREHGSHSTQPHSSSSITSAYSRLSPEDTASQLSTSLAHGLSPSEAESRLFKDGPNELPHEEPEPLWLRFLKQFKETLILLLLGSAAISFFMGNLDDAVSITLAVTIVVTVGFVQEYRSEKSLEALNKLVPNHAHLRRTGLTSHRATRTPKEGESVELEPLTNGTASSVDSSSTVLASKLVAGDLVFFSTGDRVPADVRITKAADLTIDESNLTGENEPVMKVADILSDGYFGTQNVNLNDPPKSPMFASPAAGTVGTDVRLNEQHNIAFMGTLVRSGYGQGIVIATGGRTEFGSISLSLQEIESPRTPLQVSMDRLGKELSYMSFVVIFLIGVVGLIQGRKLLEMFTIAVSLAVAAIPEGLPIIVTVTLALGVLRMAKRGAIVRKLPSVETLGSVNVVCSDKTGTLTLNHMTVTKMWHFDAGMPFDIDKEILSSPGPTVRTIFRVGNIANNGRLSSSNPSAQPTPASAAILSSTSDRSSGSVKSRWVGQPTDIAVLDLLDAFGEDDVRESVGTRVAETPFSSERKWMGVITGKAVGDTTNLHSSGSEVAYIKGALEQVLKRCDTYLTKDGREVVLDDARRAEATKAANSMAEDGLRVIGFASGPASKRLGVPSRSSTPKMQADRGHSRFEKLRHEEDNSYNGLTFAGMVGMNDPPRKDVHRSIARLRTGGVKVIMITGDSETTAIAIAKKLGMPINTNNPEALPVLRGDELDRMTEHQLSEAIVKTSIFARTSPDHKMKIIRALQARGDVVAMTGDGVNDAPALKKADIGISMGVLGTDVAKEAADMILTDDNFSTILQAIEQGKDILMDGPPAQSLGVEPVDPRIMTLPPRSRTARVLTRNLMRRVAMSAFVIMFGTMMIYIREMENDIDESTKSSSYTSSKGSTHNTAILSNHNKIVTRRDTTMTFTTFVLFDMFNALTCRSESKSVLFGELQLFGNRMFTYAVAGSLAGQACVIYLPFLQRVFQTEALGFKDVLGLIAIASSVFWLDEARKYWEKRKRSMGLPSGYARAV
ncbi:MAG: hypothetical protein Q9227_004274 [Pyrenula ochraceoflavens]